MVSTISGLELSRFAADAVACSKEAPSEIRDVHTVIRRNTDTAGKPEAKLHHSANRGSGVEQPVPQK